MTQRGVAYQLWEAVEHERLTRGWTKTQLAEHVGLPRTTLNNLEASPKPPLPRTVHAIADALGFKREEAETWAGLRRRSAGEGDISAREAVLRDPNYTDAQRQTMLELMDLFARANDQATDTEPGRKVG
ncbi:helix-turn-helix transcriptional regulator [Micromonosporaceae bacterium B7E4]